MSKVYIYGLRDPQTLEIRYIGKAKNPRRRLSYHLIPSQLTFRTHKTNWLKSLLRKNTKPILLILEKIVETEWANRERFWISHYRSKGYNLVNGTDGGDGTVGYRHSLETRKRLSKSHMGLISGMKGKTHSVEIRKQIGESARGNKRFLGRKHSVETKHKIRMNHKDVSGNKNPFYGKRHSDITKEKMRLAWKRRK